MSNTVKVTYRNCELQFSDTDIVNPDDFIPDGECNPHNVRPWLLHDHGFTVAIVFADCPQDALDVAVDENKLDRFSIDLTDEGQRVHYLTDNFANADSGLDEDCPEWADDNGKPYWWAKGMTPAFLGNAGEPFDIEALGYVELRNPPHSISALFNAAPPEYREALSAHFA